MPGASSHSNDCTIPQIPPCCQKTIVSLLTACLVLGHVALHHNYKKNLNMGPE